ncbi:protein kinase domain-containing protein [Ditylenchus destructor]|nr:protein kinase domain-containing protein [Ditylenchus destructor]
MKQFIVVIAICSSISKIIANHGHGVHPQVANQNQGHPINQYFSKIADIGTNGKVSLFLHTPTNTRCAFKEVHFVPCDISHNQIANQMRHFDQFKIEFDFVMSLDTKYVAKHHYTIWDEQCTTYFISPYYAIGNVASLLTFTGPLHADALHFMAVNMIIAFHYLHTAISNTIDKFQYLKPDSIIIGNDGYVLIDFGLFKEHSANGWHIKLKYIAPEITQAKGWTPVTDWWTIGAILYEMATGNAPPTPAIFGREWAGKPLADLIAGLLDPNPQTRLGANGIEAIYAHKYFQESGLRTEKDWFNAAAKIHNRDKTVIPPYIPEVLDSEGLLLKVRDTKTNALLENKSKTANPLQHFGVSWPPPMQFVEVKGNGNMFEAMNIDNDWPMSNA